MPPKNIPDCICNFIYMYRGIDRPNMIGRLSYTVLHSFYLHKRVARLGLLD